MKKSIIIVFTLFFYSTYAQTVTMNLGDFDTVKIFDKISAQLIPSDENRMEIKGNRASEVEILNSNGDLKIRMPFPKLMKGDEIEVTLFYKQLKAIEASEGSFVRAETPMQSIGFSLNVKEGANIIVELDVKYTNIKLSTGGILSVKGTTENQDIVMTSGSILKAKDFYSKQTTITVNAGGEADVFATEYVNAKVRAGGSIYIYGSPKQIDENTVVGGTIKEMK